VYFARAPWMRNKLPVFVDSNRNGSVVFRVIHSQYGGVNEWCGKM